MSTLGGYSAFSAELSNEAKLAFADALEHFVGVEYQPVAVATQVVAGTNFAFFCNASVVAPNSSTYPAIVHVFRSLEGKASITHIEQVSTVLR
ncbi:hypothetical protein EXT48_01280 [Pseudoalteromonas sp. CO348]|uniref:hypothetical protein n=1 Tax=Pseudoalteromonas sp. CO348 TaxID=1777271 RepID=UPI0010234C3A|nr:hypothetical protein [Pseudoalteromonas sp. CO348]RZG09691.1 hypothetical protein EXT48_01280 [Pseudoalteromonas sp. CO348]